MPQTSGSLSQGLPAWIAAKPSENLVDTDVVLWHTFGITHFPSPEDFPIMPAEPMTLLLRPVLQLLASLLQGHCTRRLCSRGGSTRGPRWGREEHGRVALCNAVSYSTPIHYYVDRPGTYDNERHGCKHAD